MRKWCPRNTRNTRKADRKRRKRGKGRMRKGLTLSPQRAQRREGEEEEEDEPARNLCPRNTRRARKSEAEGSWDRNLSDLGGLGVRQFGEVPTEHTEYSEGGSEKAERGKGRMRKGLTQSPQRAQRREGKRRRRRGVFAHETHEDHESRMRNGGIWCSENLGGGRMRRLPAFS